MCGVPHHSAANYISKLVRKGYRVAICEQTEEAAKTKKLVRREVVRIVTPGTPIDPQLLEPRESTYLGAVYARGESVAAAFLDVSTGEFRATQANGPEAWERIAADIDSYAPRELLFPVSLGPLVRAGFKPLSHTEPLPLNSPAGGTSHANGTPDIFGGATLTAPDDWLWQTEAAESVLPEHFQVRALEGYGLTRKKEAINAAGSCLRYARDTQRGSAAHINDIVYLEPQDFLVLDNITVRNLELIKPLGSDGSARSLLDVIDETQTGMGARLLRTWLLRPSVRRAEVEARHGAIAELQASHMKRDALRANLKEVADMERLSGRLNLGSATPRDLLAIGRSLEHSPGVRRTTHAA